MEDRRDGKLYYVTREADGHCWMTQNLDLDLTVSGSTMGNKDSSGAHVALSSTYTDLNTANWTIPNGSVGYATQTTSGTLWNRYGSNNPSNIETGNSTYEVRSYDPGDSCNTYISRTSGDTTNKCVPLTVAPNHGHLGNSYTWITATAGSGTYSTGTQYYNAPNSICPKGWKLPTGAQASTANNQFNVLLNKANSNIPLSTTSITNTDSIADTIGKANLWFVMGGDYYYGTGTLNSIRTTANYWSRSNATNYDAYELYFSSSDVQPGTGGVYKGRGSSVRCLM